MPLAIAFILLAWAGLSSAMAAPQPIEIPVGTMQLRAFLYKPPGEGPFPAIVALHGCSGLNGRSGPVALLYRDWGERLAAEGFAVVFPDSFGSRGQSSQCSIRERAVRTWRERVSDADAARQW